MKSTIVPLVTLLKVQEMVEEMTNHRLLKEPLHPDPASNATKVSLTSKKEATPPTPPCEPTKYLLIGTILLLDP